MRSKKVYWILVIGVAVITLIVLLITRGGDKPPGEVGSTAPDGSPVDSRDSTTSGGVSGSLPAVKLSSWVVKNKYGDVPDARPESVKPRRLGFNNRFQIEFNSPVPKTVLILTLRRDDVLT